MPDLSWVGHLVGAFATAFFAHTVFSGRARDFTSLALASGLIALSSLLGAGWTVHPAAGLLLAFLIGWMDGGSRRWNENLPMLGVALLSAAAFMLLGAGWLQFPLGIIMVITAFSYLMKLGGPARSANPPALPGAASGTPVQPVRLPEGVPVQDATAGFPSARQAAPAPEPAGTVPTGGLAALVQDPRLPAEARALVVAIDDRTAEAVKALHAQGQTGTRAAYEARAIREEYVPAAVQAYLKLPPTRAETTPIEGTRTGRDLLMEQLTLLLGAAQNILEATAQSGGQELLSSTRFLREKFGKAVLDEHDLKLKP